MDEEAGQHQRQQHPRARRKWIRHYSRFKRLSLPYMSASIEWKGLLRTLPIGQERTVAVGLTERCQTPCMTLRYC